MKKEAANHTKMKRLCRYLDVPRCMAAGIMELLWHLTSVEAPAGDIGKLSNEDIALGIDYRGDEDALIAALQKAGWIDEHPDHRLVIHDWWDHCEDSVHMKLARLRRCFADGKPPKLARLPKPERLAAEKHFGTFTADDAEDEHGGAPASAPEGELEYTEEPAVATETESVRTASVRHAHVGMPPASNHPIPYPSIPSPSIPSQNRTDDRTVAVNPNSAAAIGPPPDVRSIGTLIQKKTNPPPRPPAAGVSRERIEEMRKALHGFMSHPLPDLPARQVKPPDPAIVDRCLLAVGETPIPAVVRFLRSLQLHHKLPEGGPRSYAWFETTLRAEFSSEAA
jgi:hypothetical protein